MEVRALLITVAISIGLIGCATPYQKNGLTGGYSEKKLSDSAYFVHFDGNGYASKERVHIFWLYRCAELTVQKGFDLMILRPGESTADLRSAAESSIRPASFDHSINGQPTYATRSAVWRPGEDDPKMQNAAYYYSYSTITTWNSKGTVVMYHAPLPEELVWAIDARRLMGQLRPYVDSDGSKPAPKDAIAAMNSTVAHETIRFPEGNLSVSGNTASASLPLRDSREIIGRFNDSLIGFHSLFRERKRIEGTTSSGTIFLGFTITPNGDVSECHIISSSFKSSGFEETVRRGVAKFSFSPKNVATTTVSSFFISFEPESHGPI